MQIKTTHIICLLLSLLLAGTVSAAESVKQARNNAAPIAAQAVVPVTVLSIIPVQAEPGTKVTISGTGFGENATVYLGSTENAALITDGKQAEVTVPQQLQPGLYVLYLKRPDGVAGRSYNFTVLPLRPVLTALMPSSISSCASGRERDIIARGSNFTDSSLLFFNGAALPATILSPESISFSVPVIPGGLHHVQVKNGPDTSSVPLNFVVETRPEIGQVTIGTEHVNSYELIISGRNFNQNSSLYVDGMQIGGRGGQDITDREKLNYVDCSKLIYQRHPYSPVNKDFRLQVVNSGGEGSQVITVSAP